MSVLEGEVQIPKLGGVKKRTLAIVGVIATGFVGWKYWQNRGVTSYSGDTTDGTDPGFGDAGVLPSVSGAVSGDNSYGISDGSTSPTVDTYGFTGTTNAQWTQYASTQLVNSDVWSYTDIVTALGNYLNSKPLTTTQQQIVQAAIAVAGYPPTGTHPIISGGDAKITVAPTGLKVVSKTSTTVTLSCNPVAGAGYYRWYRSGASTNVGSSDGPNVTISGLTPNTSYSFQVAADTTNGSPGPKSGSVTTKTESVNLATPATPTVSAITTTTAKVTTKTVSGATGYNWYINGIAHGHSDAPTYTVSGLKPKTRYAVSVAADNNTQAPGKQSARKSFTTKTK